MSRARGRLHVGRRGRCLAFFAALDLIYAVSLMAPDPATRETAFFQWLADTLPMWVWAGLWAATGLICGWFMFQRFDRAGFAAAIFLKVLWGAVCLGGWATGHVERGYVAGAIWLGLAYLVWNLSGWREPGDTRGPTWAPPTT